MASPKAKTIQQRFGFADQDQPFQGGIFTFF
jgi:hypothetical protein